MGKRKLMSPLSSNAQPVIKYKRTCEEPPSSNGAKTLTEQEYLKLKLYLKEKKKILKVSTYYNINIVFFTFINFININNYQLLTIKIII